MWTYTITTRAHQSTYNYRLPHHHSNTIPRFLCRGARTFDPNCKLFQLNGLISPKRALFGFGYLHPMQQRHRASNGGIPTISKLFRKAAKCLPLRSVLSNEHTRFIYHSWVRKKCKRAFWFKFKRCVTRNSCVCAFDFRALTITWHPDTCIYSTYTHSLHTRNGAQANNGIIICLVKFF